MSVKASTLDPELLAAAAVAELAAPPRRERLALVRELGSFRAALSRLRGSRSAVTAAESALAAIEDAGFHALCMTDPGYPRLLRAAPDPPFVLSLWGRLEPEDALALAVVGSRRATRYGLDMANRLTSDLASAGLTIVSGLARGIDAAAHRGALASGGRTIAVLGSGLDNVYPREHRNLAERIAERGAVLSELPVGEPPRSGNFPRRNRIITGMALGTLVVEAALKSGSLVSARMAMEQDREVFAVPGPALSPVSEGAHALIRDGAKLVTTAGDVIEELRPEVRQLLETRSATTTNDGPRDALDAIEKIIFDYLASEQQPIDIDTVLEQTEIPTPTALAALSRLEVKGRVWSLEGGFYQARP